MTTANTLSFNEWQELTTPGFQRIQCLREQTLGIELRSVEVITKCTLLHPAVQAYFSTQISGLWSRHVLRKRWGEGKERILLSFYSTRKQEAGVKTKRERYFYTIKPTPWNTRVHQSTWVIKACVAKVYHALCNIRQLGQLLPSPPSGTGCYFIPWHA